MTNEERRSEYGARNVVSRKQTAWAWSLDPRSPFVVCCPCSTSLLADVVIMSTHPSQQTKDYRALPRIARLWVDLSVSVNGVPPRDIFERRATFPWQSQDASVMAAWDALTSPENLDDLLEWAGKDMNARARLFTDKAVEVCRRRRATNSEPGAALNGDRSTQPSNSGGTQRPPSVS